MRYLLGGYYGMRNVGDDILLYVTLAGVRDVDPDARFTVISERSELTPPETAVSLEPGGRWLETPRQLRRHDIWLFGGGGLLQDGSDRSRETVQRLSQVARVLPWTRRKIALLGIGIGPLVTRQGRDAARRLLDAADFISVRDRESGDIAAQLASGRRVHVTADLAFLLPRYAPIAMPEPESSRSPVTLGVSLLPFAASLGRDARSDLEAADRIAEVLNAVQRKHSNLTVKLFEFFSGSREYSDSLILEAVRRRLAFCDRVRYRPYDGDFISVYREIQACSAFMGMRFHACLLAHLASLPCLMLAYHPKSESLATRLRLPSGAVAPLSLLEDPRGLVARIESLLTDSEKFRPTIAVQSLSDEAARNFSLFANWIHQHLRTSS